ncbi:MAG: hypothetical protein QOF27_2237, partial [Gaiellaceae bacterium]|nr:hypothetical protein [Gaiellaceae bacterium]
LVSSLCEGYLLAPRFRFCGSVERSLAEVVCQNEVGKCHLLVAPDFWQTCSDGVRRPDSLFGLDGHTGPHFRSGRSLFSFSEGTPRAAPVQVASPLSPGRSLDDEPVRLCGGYRQYARRAVGRPQDQPIAIEHPGSGGLLGPIGRARRALDVASVRAHLECRATAGWGKGEGSRPIDELGFGVIFVRMHPSPFQVRPVEGHWASFLRGPAKVAFILATCPAVNITIEASST